MTFLWARTTSHHFYGAVMLCFCALWAVGCGASGDNKLGAAGEGCFADEDCRPDLVCEQSLCVNFEGAGELGNNARRDVDRNNEVPVNNEPGNNSNNNVSENPGISRDEACGKICGKVVGCNLLGEEACIELCFGRLQFYPESILEDVAECVDAASCNSLITIIEVCAPPPEAASFSRRNLCDAMAFEDLTSCVPRDVAVRFSQICSVLGSFYDDDEFNALAECFETNDCDSRLSCLEGWVGTDVVLW